MSSPLPASVIRARKDERAPLKHTLTIRYHDGEVENVEVASHAFIYTIKIYCINGEFSESRIGPDGERRESRYRLEPSPAPYLEYVTPDDLWTTVPMSSIKRIHFDKRWSKIISENSKK